MLEKTRFKVNHKSCLISQGYVYFPTPIIWKEILQLNNLHGRKFKRDLNGIALRDIVRAAFKKAFA